jgi:hypothetical protein
LFVSPVTVKTHVATMPSSGGMRTLIKHHTRSRPSS